MKIPSHRRFIPEISGKLSARDCIHALAATKMAQHPDGVQVNLWSNSTRQITLGADRMPKRKPTAGRYAPEHMPELLEALGRVFNSSEQRDITGVISKMARRYWASQTQPTVAQAGSILRQIADNRARERKLWEKLDTIRAQIDAAAYFRRPEIEPSHVLLVRDIIFKKHRDDLDEKLQERDLNIDFLIKNPKVFGQLLNRADPKDYRKRPESAGVIEPFLDLLQYYRVVPSNRYPQTKMIKALFRVIGTKPPPEASVRQIVNARKRKGARRARNFSALG